MLKEVGRRQNQWQLHPEVQTAIFGQEEVTSGVFALRAMGPIFGKEKQFRFANYTYYLRELDNLTDNGSNPLATRQVLQGEMDNLAAMINGEPSHRKTSFPARESLLFGLQRIAPRTKAPILSSIQDIARGIHMDNEGIISKEPLPEADLDQRHLLQSQSVFNLLSLVLFDRPLLHEPNPRVEQLFKTWIRYDALRDLGPDLSAGMVLFPQRELDSFDVVLQPGEAIPEEGRAMFEYLKEDTIVDLQEQAGAIYETTFPKRYAAIAARYFRSRAKKLARSTYSVTPETRFAQNLQVDVDPREYSIFPGQ